MFWMTPKYLRTYLKLLVLFVLPSQLLLLTLRVNSWLLKHLQRLCLAFLKKFKKYWIILSNLPSVKSHLHVTNANWLVKWLKHKKIPLLLWSVLKLVKLTPALDNQKALHPQVNSGRVSVVMSLKVLVLQLKHKLALKKWLTVQLMTYWMK